MQSQQIMLRIVALLAILFTVRGIGSEGYEPSPPHMDDWERLDWDALEKDNLERILTKESQNFFSQYPILLVAEAVAPLPADVTEMILKVRNLHESTVRVGMKYVQPLKAEYEAKRAVLETRIKLMDLVRQRTELVNEKIADLDKQHEQAMQTLWSKLWSYASIDYKREADKYEHQLLELAEDQIWIDIRDQYDYSENHYHWNFVMQTAMTYDPRGHPERFERDVILKQVALYYQRLARFKHAIGRSDASFNKPERDFTLGYGIDRLALSTWVSIGDSSLNAGSGPN